MTEPDDDHAMESGIGPAIAAPIEPVTIRLAGRGGDRADPAQLRDPVNRAIFTVLGDSTNLNDAAPSEEGGVAEKVESLRAKRLPPMDQPERVRAVSDCVLRLRQRHIHTRKAEESRMLPGGPQALASDPEEAEALAKLLVDNTTQLRDLFARGS